MIECRWSSARAVLLDNGERLTRLGVGSMGERLFTDKLVVRWLEGFGVWSLDSATPATIAYPAHASGLPVRLGQQDPQRILLHNS